MPSRERDAIARIQVGIADLGLAPPPVALQIKGVRGGNMWSIYARPEEEGTGQAAAKWLLAMGPVRIELGSRSIVRADFGSRPEPWASLAEGVTIGFIRLLPPERALLAVQGSQSAMARFAERVGRDVPAPADAAAPQPNALLTPLQNEALRVAVRSGYYLIPRPVNLRDLGRDCGVTAASLSERLRRAEGRILTAYVQTRPELPPSISGWEERAWDETSAFPADARRASEG